MRITHDGTGAWAFTSGSQGLAHVELSGPHVETIALDQAIADVFEVDRGLLGKALVILHGSANSLRNGAATADESALGWRSAVWRGGDSVTVLDAIDPNPVKARHFTSLLLEGLLP